MTRDPQSAGWMWSHRGSLISTACLLVNLSFVAVFSTGVSDLHPTPYPPLSHKLVAAGIIIAANLVVVVSEARAWLSLWTVVMGAINVAVAILVLAFVSGILAVLIA